MRATGAERGFRWCPPCRSPPTPRGPRSCRSPWRPGPGRFRRRCCRPARGRRWPARSWHGGKSRTGAGHRPPAPRRDGQPAGGPGRGRAGARPGAPVRRRRPLGAGADAGGRGGAAGGRHPGAAAHRARHRRPPRIGGGGLRCGVDPPDRGRPGRRARHLRAAHRAAGDRRRTGRGARRRAQRSPRPRRPPCGPWTEDLAALPDPEPGVLRVLAGDFNATLDHADLRAVRPRLRRRGLGGGRRAGLDVAAAAAPASPARPRPRARRPRITVAAVQLATVARATTGPSSPTSCCRPADTDVHRSAGLGTVTPRWRPSECAALRGEHPC